MHSAAIIKYAFCIRTRLGVVVENLMIYGRDEVDAYQKLRRMYLGCKVVHCVRHFGSVRVPVPCCWESGAMANQ